MAWAVGIPIASYRRLERGQLRSPPLGWLVNSMIVLGYHFPDLIDDEMLGWHHLDRIEPPPKSWYERPEVHARAERHQREEKRG